MLRIAVVGLGKMGISHLSIVNSHPEVKLVAICDSAKYVLDVLTRYTGIDTFTDYEKMLETIKLDAVIISTPPFLHNSMVYSALARGLHVFCEKPFSLSSIEGLKLASIAHDRKLVNQVGYHYRFVETFAEVSKLLQAQAIGRVTHVLAEAYGPVVLAPKGLTWRTQKNTGGGCLYDYAAHVLDLITWYFGMPHRAGGVALNSVFSAEIEDEVYGTLYFDGGPTVQVSVNWSDESTRKMSTKMTLMGTNGRIYADRQEIQVYLRRAVDELTDYRAGWNVKYVTDFIKPTFFYLRGEEYSAQIAHFLDHCKRNDIHPRSTFESASLTDTVIEMFVAANSAASKTADLHVVRNAVGASRLKRSGLWSAFRGAGR